MMDIKNSYGPLRKLMSFIIVFAWCLSLSCTAVLAADEIGDEPDDVQSYFSNPAQAAHAANLAEASALSDEEAAAVEQEAMENLDKAQAALDAGEITEEEFAEIETAINDRLAGISGVSAEEIGEMRSAGLGWGEIAHELGVHPSALGLGHKNRERNRIANQEMIEATQRNTKTGYAKGYGARLGAGDDGFGVASSKGFKGSSKSTAAAGLSGNKGKSNSGNDKGGKGQGNGNSGGGNNGRGNNGGGNGKK